MDADEDMDSLIEAFARSLGAGFVETGEIDPAGMTPTELADAIAAKIKEVLANDAKFSVVIDHQGGLLAQARSFAQEQRTDFAVMFYATWIEHWLNRMIAWKLRLLGRDEKLTRRQLMRLGLDQKVGAAWALLFEDSLSQDLAARIREVAEARNSFVHYKWEAIDPDHAPASEQMSAEKDLLARAESAIVELEAIRDRLVMGGIGAVEFFSESGGRTRYLRRGESSP